MKPKCLALLLFLCAVAAVAISGTPAHAQVSGAIWTTDIDGTVDENIYSCKKDVYLNGGPKGSNPAGLPPGEYYVQVTEPNGTLLGSSYDETPVLVNSDGKFDEVYKLWDIVYKASNSHTKGYDDTGNSGGEYKVWVSKDPDFANSQSKTDNFKVVKVHGNDEPPPQTDINVLKFYDRDADGVWDGRGEIGGEPPIPDWHFELWDAEGMVSCGLTDADGKVTFVVPFEDPPTTYTVVEVLPGDPETTPWRSSTAQQVGVTADAPTKEVLFGNYCVVYADFDTKGYWHNKNGLTELTDEDITLVNGLAPYLAPSSYFGDGDEPFDGLFTDGNLVEAAFNDDGDEIWGAGSWQAEVSQFLVDPNAGGDPREQLAQQLLAFIFNTLHRLDDPDAIILLPGGGVSASALIADAIAAWQSGSDNDRNSCAALLDLLNNDNDLPVICPEPCPFDPVPCNP